MRKILTVAVVAIVVSACNTSSIAYKENVTSGISAESLDSARTTDCMDVSAFDKLWFELELTDVDDSVTAVTVVCSTSREGTCAVDHQIQGSAYSSGTYTLLDGSYSKATTTTADYWAFGPLEIGWRFVSCLVSGTGSPDSGDEATLYVSGSVD